MLRTHQSGPRCASLRPPVSWPAYRPLSIPPFGLGRTRLRSTSRSALIPPASLTWTTCFTCAPRLPMPPTHQSGPCCLGHRPHALPSPGPPAALSACLPLDLAGHECVQPAVDVRHVQRHYHGLHVSGALRACPCHPLTSRSHAARHLSHRPHALPSPGPPAALSSMPSLRTRQRVTAFNQPLSFDTSSVTTMEYMFYVRSAPAHETHSPVGPTPRVT